MKIRATISLINTGFFATAVNTFSSANILATPKGKSL